MMKMKVTFFGRWRSQAKVKVNQKWTYGHISHTITLTDIIPGTKVQYNKQHLMTKYFRPWLKVKVTTQGQRSQTWRCLRSLNASCYNYEDSINNVGSMLISIKCYMSFDTYWITLKHPRAFTHTYKLAQKHTHTHIHRWDL